MEVSRIEQIEERQKWQQAYQSLALRLENRDPGIVSGSDNSPNSSNPKGKESDSRQLNSSSDSKCDDVFAQVRN